MTIKLPPPPVKVALIDENNKVTQEWARWLTQVQKMLTDKKG